MYWMLGELMQADLLSLLSLTHLHGLGSGWTATQRGGDNEGEGEECSEEGVGPRLQRHFDRGRRWTHPATSTSTTTGNGTTTQDRFRIHQTAPILNITA